MRLAEGVPSAWYLITPDVCNNPSFAGNEKLKILPNGNLAVMFWLTLGVIINS